METTTNETAHFTMYAEDGTLIRLGTEENPSESVTEHHRLPIVNMAHLPSGTITLMPSPGLRGNPTRTDPIRTNPTRTDPIRTSCGLAVQAVQILARFAVYKYPADQSLLAWAVARTFAALRSDPSVIAADQVRLAAIKRYGKDSGDGSTNVPLDLLPAFLAEYQPVADQTIELHIPKLPDGLTKFLPDDGATPNELTALLPFIQE